MSRKSNDLKGKLQQIEKLTLFQNPIGGKLWNLIIAFAPFAQPPKHIKA